MTRCFKGKPGHLYLGPILSKLMQKVYRYLLPLSLATFIFIIQARAQSWEVYDLKGNLKSRALYQKIQVLSETVLVGKNENGLFLLSRDLQPMVNLQGDEVYRYLEPWILIKGATGIGAFHEYGQLSLPLEYDEIQTYFNILVARKGNEYWIYQRGTGKTIPLGILDEARITHHGMVITRKNGKFFLPLSINPTKSYDRLEENEGSFLLAKEASGYGLINREGNYVMDPVIDQMEHTRGDYFYAQDENQYLLIRGDEIKAQVSYNSYHRISKDGDLMLEYIHGKLRRVMEEDGILLDAVGMENVTLIGKELYNVKFRENKLGLLGKKGWLVQPQSDADWIGMGSEGLFPAQKGGKYGFLNPSGAWVIEPKFTAVNPFSESYASVSQQNLWEIIGKNGQTVASDSWDELREFKDGVSISRKSDELYLINSSGSRVNEHGFEKICRLETGFFLVEKNQKRGLLSLTGEEILAPEFDQIQVENEQFILVRKNGKVGVLKSSGEVLFPLDYLEIVPDWSGNQIYIQAPYEPVVIPISEPEERKRKKGAE